MSSTPKLVLVTGANGYLGSAVVQHCLEHGYHVRGTVRSQAKAEGVKGCCSRSMAQLCLSLPSTT